MAALQNGKGDVSMRERILNLIEKTKVVAIIRGLTKDEAIRAAEALSDGDIKLVEVTFNQREPASFIETAETISAIKEKLGDKMGVGAGTVVTMEQLKLAKKYGAEFIVSPDTDEKIIAKTVKLDMVSLPGAYTATEIKKAHNAGADYVKLFPCTDNATSYIKAVKAPLSHIKLLAVGGVDAENAADFIKAGACGVGVGSSLVNKKWIKCGEYDKITAEAKKMIENINQNGEN